ncbi:MAG: CapA family protein [Acetatifactor sp.]|nr:CapA family protein [Acetatifactor sp.]
MKYRRSIHRIAIHVTIMLFVCLGVCAYDFFRQEPASGQAITDASAPLPTPSRNPAPEPTSEPIPEPFQEYDITLMALGDNLMHMGVVRTGKQNDGSYDFSFLFQNISEYIKKADIRMINQETIFGGDQIGFSGYPYFNSPTEVGDAIAAAGFNVVLHATNHAADQGIDGLKNCVSFWEQYPDILVAGISGDEQPEEIPLLAIDDVTFAILNYTYGPNAATVDQSLRGHLNTLCDCNPKTGAIDFTTLNPKVIQDIREAKFKADIVIVCPHWGTEYVTAPSRYQKAFAEEMAAAGADLIIGTHPHVPQPVEWITSEDGHKTLCYYSLGNYVSTQKDALCMLEEMAWVRFRVTEDQVFIDEDSSGVLPLVCHYTSGPVRLGGVYPLEDYTEELARKHGIWNYGGVALHMEDLQQKCDEILGDMILSKSDILSP